MYSEIRHCSCMGYCNSYHIPGQLSSFAEAWTQQASTALEVPSVMPLGKEASLLKRSAGLA